MSFDDYESKCETIRETNRQLLDLFQTDLEKSGLSQKTVSRHLSNVDFYINTFLLYYDACSVESGTGMIDSFPGDFFIRKCTWSTPGTIRSNAASIKKFYKCMLDHGKISKADYGFLCSEIKDGMETWQEDCALFNDPDAPNPFFFF